MANGSPSSSSSWREDGQVGKKKEDEGAITFRALTCQKCHVLNAYNEIIKEMRLIPLNFSTLLFPLGVGPTWKQASKKQASPVQMKTTKLTCSTFNQPKRRRMCMEKTPCDNPDVKS